MSLLLSLMDTGITSNSTPIYALQSTFNHNILVYIGNMTEFTVWGVSSRAATRSLDLTHVTVTSSMSM